MATRRKSTPPAARVPVELTVTRDEAKQRLKDRIEKGTELKGTQINTREAFEELKKKYSTWDSYNSELLRRIFTTDEAAKEYDYWGVMAVSIFEESLGKKIADTYNDIDTKIHRIDSLIERLELIPIADQLSPGATTSLPTSQLGSKKVFVVHGHDEVAKASLEVFLHEIGLEPIVLHRQADEGLTIIEKFEKHSDVGYAFILLTPDEVAYVVAEAAKPEALRITEFRARPNVIFEFGYFVGKLGRSRVCCLYTGDVSLPSDVSGMIYKKYEKSIEEVAYGVIKDLKASGYQVA